MSEAMFNAGEAEPIYYSEEEIARNKQAALLALTSSENVAEGKLAEAFREITHTASQVLRVDRVGIWLFNDEKTEIVCYDMYISTERQHASGEIFHLADFPEYYKIIREGKSVVAMDVLSDERTRDFSEKYLIPNKIASSIDVPFRANRVIAGVITCEHIHDQRKWTREDENFISALADIISRVVEIKGRRKAEAELRKINEELENRISRRTAKLQQVNAALVEKKETLEKELKFAAVIQQSIIGNHINLWNALHFHSCYKPVNEVSGDYFDIFRFNSCVFLLVVDVSGHGIPAALITMLAKQVFYTSTDASKNPADICRSAHRQLQELLQTRDYLSAFLMKIDKNNKAVYCSAGHPPAYLHRPKENLLKELDTSGSLIGVSLKGIEETFENKEIQLKSGDRIYMFTDGLVEPENGAGEPFGAKYLPQELIKGENLPLNEMVKSLPEKLKDFAGEENVKDDITILAFEVDRNWKEYAQVFNRGLKNLRLNNLENALQEFSLAEKIISTHPDLHLLQAKTCMRLGKYDQATHYIELVLGINTRNINALYIACRLYILKNQVEKALRIENIMVSMYPNTPQTQKVRTLLNFLRGRAKD